MGGAKFAKKAIFFLKIASQLQHILEVNWMHGYDPNEVVYLILKFMALSWSFLPKTVKRMVHRSVVQDLERGQYGNIFENVLKLKNISSWLQYTF